MRLFRKRLVEIVGLVLMFWSGCWSPISKPAQEVFLGRTGQIRVTLFPVNVIRGSTITGNLQLAQGIGDFLRQQKLAEVACSPTSIAMPIRWSHNQAKLAQRRAIAFAARVKELQLETDYALLVEILCNPAGNQVIAVHFYLADKSGRIADARLTNSHWEEFRAINPRTPADGQIVAQKLLQKAWREL